MTNIKSQNLVTKIELAIQECPTLQNLSQSCLYELVQAAEKVEFTENELIFEQGSNAKHWYLVVEGQVETFRYGLDGENRIFKQLNIGSLLAPVVMFMSDGRYPVSGRSNSPVILCKFNKQDLISLCMKEPILGVKILELAGEILSGKLDEVENLTSKNGKQRIANYLYQNSLKQGETVEINMLHKELAATLGIRSETFSRLLKKLQQDGVIRISKTKIQILSIDKLKRFI